MSSSDVWSVAPAEGIEIQKRLRPRVRRSWDGRAIKLIAGADVHFPSKGAARGALVILAYPGFEIVDSSVFEGPCAFPYVPGLLSFREIPALLEAWKELRATPDCILCDGQGIAHPRGLGLASHLGLVLGIPSIGSVVRTRDRTKPLFVSVGHLVSLRKAVSIVLSCTGRFRIPEPLRAAHRLAGTGRI